MATLVPPVSATDAVRRALQGRRSSLAGLAFQAVVMVALLVSLLILVVLLADVVSGGWGVLVGRGWDFLTSPTSPDPGEVGVWQGIRGSLFIAVAITVIAFPLGVGAALYMEEYAPDNRFTRLIDVTIRNLAGVPSVVYGILGLAIFVQALARLTGGDSVLSAGVTIAILVLPIVIITSAEAIRAVPDSIREAGFGVGATRWEVIRSHVLPYAAPGILTGTVLSLSRGLGEAAPLILVGAIDGFFVTGGDPGLLDELQGKFTALPNLVFNFAQQPGRVFVEEIAPATIIVLLSVVLLANVAAILARNHYEKKR
ncbi:MAG: phosphate ABC transporter permease PstA [Acidimicrobiales bacterium]